MSLNILSHKSLRQFAWETFLYNQNPCHSLNATHFPRTAQNKHIVYDIFTLDTLHSHLSASAKRFFKTVNPTTSNSPQNLFQCSNTLLTLRRHVLKRTKNQYFYQFFYKPTTKTCQNLKFSLTLTPSTYKTS